MRFLFFCLILGLTSTFHAQLFHFQSGFERGVYLSQYELNGSSNQSYADIYGEDSISNYNWVEDLDNASEVGNFRLYYEVGDTNSAVASITSDPQNSLNKVLKFQLISPNVPNNGNPKGRIQAAINNNVDLKEFSFI